MDGMQHIGPVVRQLADLLRPSLIYLYNQKHNLRGEITAFKLCAVAPVADKPAAEREVYRSVDCDIPFDILLYTPREWEELIADADTFARQIVETGTVVYG